MTKHRVLHLQRRNQRAPAEHPKDSPRDQVHQEKQHRPILWIVFGVSANQNFCVLQPIRDARLAAMPDVPDYSRAAARRTATSRLPEIALGLAILSLVVAILSLVVSLAS
jgi:hypothetical protein